MQTIARAFLTNHSCVTPVAAIKLVLCHATIEHGPKVEQMSVSHSLPADSTGTCLLLDHGNASDCSKAD